ncbi:GMC family oxidoreductase N-terminal domain-containing protein [Belnapia sp. T18]|uniref:GMC family oxidoreductase N-terminal domain-containing protein n=1 Tax=Belnapia arida TaxID=2804533 RepID=A0ABS1UB19_9PROT|nr:GMC family oxidoreductase N-terminal domain-containing protein [Belnapia arida]MBL6081876.1 GMC family oxidoreductase N-terminal domain-containing protein [Belnapia arida]
MAIHDVIVVGAGSAGGPVGVRLAENPELSILLLEAGTDHGTEATMPSDLLDGGRLAGMTHDWHYSAVPVDGRAMPYRRGRVVGGTSAINAAAAMWPRPTDLERWAALGNPAWNWAEVLPWLRRIEADTDAPDLGPHGRVGPVEIRRHREPELIPLQRAFATACREVLGLPAVADHNDVRVAGGVGPWPMNRRADNTRISTALAYLEPARQRANLAIRGEAMVDRLLIENGRAAGVVLAGGQALAARRGVVLCAGALGTPAILLRSGIGPAEELAALGIRPWLDRPGVGARLWDHPAVPVRLVPKAGQCDPLRDPRFQMVARLDTHDSAPLVLVLVSFLDISGSPALLAEAGGAPVVALVNAALMDPRSHGRLRLPSANPSAAPVIELGFDREEADLRALAEGVRLAWRVARAAPVAAETQRIVGLDEAVVGSDALLRSYIHTNLGSFNHPCGTAPMGSKGDPLAVADERGRVHGVASLWIADASLMPRGLTVPPNLASMMMGERIGSWIREELGGRQAA